MKQTDEITGTVERFVYQNDENGYGVFLVNIAKNNTVTVTGYAPGVQPGQRVQVIGDWVYHPKFGKQFEARQCTTAMPTTTVGLVKYLSSGLIKGVGALYAQRLVDHFGTNVLDVIDKEAERLTEVPGIGQQRAAKIVQSWQDQKEIANVMVFLQGKNISPAYATKIYKTYGQNSIKVVQENPYRLADDIWGIGFKIADQIALNLGLERASVERVRAGIMYAITTEVGNGHLYVELQQLKQKTIELLELDATQVEPLIKEAFHGLYNADKIKLISYQNQHFITLTQYYFSEKGVASKIARLKQYSVGHTIDIDTVYAFLRSPGIAATITLNDEQQMGIMACLQNKVTIITGGPGTGKTTLIKTLLQILEQNKLQYKLAAPTGRAAKRMTEGTGRHATTLHRLLGYDAGTRAFVHNESNALKLDFLIVDEASMIDIFLAHAVLKAVPLPAHILFIGDIDQLPSVGAGNFLNDLIASTVVTSIRLKQIFRQAQDSLIIVNAHRINNGEFPTTFLPGAQRDFVLIKEEDPTMVTTHLQTLFTKYTAKGYAAQDIMVLVPMNRGAVGTQALNHHLQQILNPIESPEQVSRHGYTFKVGDRVMQIRNNYDKLVFNGDIGTITGIDLNEQQVMITYYDKPIVYEMNELDELVLAYAVTIHKSQGSEYPVVIIPLFMQHFTLLQRNLIYTAITRAKKLCIFIGQTKALAMAIKNNKSVLRTTFLQQFLTTDLACR